MSNAKPKNKKSVEDSTEASQLDDVFEDAPPMADDPPPTAASPDHAPAGKARCPSSEMSKLTRNKPVGTTASIVTRPITGQRHRAPSDSKNVAQGAPPRDGRLLIAQCLYCDEGDVEADLEEMLAQPAYARTLDIDMGVRTGPRLFIFGRDKTVPRPCRHVLDLSISGTVSSAVDGQTADTFSFYAVWKHPWLGLYDPNESLQMFWWEMEQDAVLEPYRPASEHHLHYLPDIEYQAADGDRVVSLTGDLFAAAKPLAYLRELRAQYARR
jgi:hypothetical protein